MLLFVLLETLSTNNPLNPLTPNKKCGLLKIGLEKLDGFLGPLAPSFSSDAPTVPLASADNPTFTANFTNVGHIFQK